MYDDIKEVEDLKKLLRSKYPVMSRLSTREVENPNPEVLYLYFLSDGQRLAGYGGKLIPIEFYQTFELMSVTEPEKPDNLIPWKKENV